MKIQIRNQYLKQKSRPTITFKGNVGFVKSVSKNIRCLETPAKPLYNKCLTNDVS